MVLKTKMEGWYVFREVDYHNNNYYYRFYFHTKPMEHTVHTKFDPNESEYTIHIEIAASVETNRSPNKNKIIINMGYMYEDESEDNLISVKKPKKGIHYYMEELFGSHSSLTDTIGKLLTEPLTRKNVSFEVYPTTNTNVNSLSSTEKSALIKSQDNAIKMYNDNILEKYFSTNRSASTIRKKLSKEGMRGGTRRKNRRKTDRH
jgi:hypothetical protein